MTRRRRVSTRPTSRPTIIMATIVPSPRGPQDQPSSDNRIVHEALKIGSDEREGGKIGDANDEDKSHSGREIAVAEKSRPHKRFVRSKSVHEKQVERRRGDDGFDP